MLITENHPKRRFYSKFKKCGEITASTDGRHFGLNCSHCSAIFPWINIKQFLSHINNYHKKKLSANCAQKQKQQSQKQQLQKQQSQKQQLQKQQSQKQQLQKQQQQHQRVNKKTIKFNPTSSPQSAISATEGADDSFKEDPLESAADEDETTAKDEEDAWVSEADLEEELFEGFCEEDVDFKEAEEALKCTNESTNDSVASETHFKSSSSSSENEEEKICDLELDLQSHKNRLALSYIIEMHQKNPILWDKEHLSYHRLIKMRIYRVMIREILARFKVMLTSTGIIKIFGKLRRLYTDELLCGSEEPTKLWCFEHLDFLRTRELADNATLVLPIDQLIPLAEIYKQHPVLWDLDCDGCHNRLLQKTETQQMLQEVNEQMGLRMTLKQMRIRIVRMRRHLRLEIRKRLECEQNNEEFESSHEELYEKLQYLEPFIGPFRCDECYEEIVQYNVFKAHVAAHEGRLPFTCSFCDKDFKLYCNLVVHQRRHTGEKPFACTYCDMSFAASGDLKVHTRLHTNEKPYICHVCGVAFSTANKLTNHKAVHEPEAIRMRFQCPHCPKKYTAKEYLNTHINSHLNVRNFMCPECGKGFFGRKTLRQHMNLHDKVKRFECDLCKKKFSQKAGLCSHRRSHHKLLGNNKVL